MKKILIISFSDLENDPRVYRQIKYLSRFYQVTTIGFEPAKVDGVAFQILTTPPRSRLQRVKRAVEYKLHRFEKLYWSLYNFNCLLGRIGGERFDLVLANDVDSLPLASRLAQGAKVLLDTHEYAPRHFEDQFVWRFFFQPFNRYLCSKYLKQCDRIITVTAGVAQEYNKNYGIDPVVITNAVDYVEMSPTPVDNERIRIITHGVANPNRRLESMMEIMDHMDSRFHLDMMLVSSFPRYYSKLQRLAEKRSNVTIIPPVTREQIVPVTNPYDLSLLVFRPYTINFKYGLGNKFFQSLQARLGLVTGPSPEPQAEIVSKYGCGIVVDTFEPREIAKVLNTLTADRIMEYKKKADTAARELTAEKNMEQLGDIVKQMLS